MRLDRWARQSIFALASITIFVYVLTFYYIGVLGPYGLPGDNLHILLLITVLFIGYLVFQFTVLRRWRGTHPE